ncbi:MAG: cupin domain-containing protein [Bradyrhizobium sp.]
MSRALIEATNLVVNLTPKPIELSWIIEGNPIAQWCVLSKSADGLASTMVWECGEGKFDWYYDFDETILILEGSVVLENDSMRPTRYGVGDVIFFKNGAHARWHVEGRVRKLAFCRTTQPYLFGFALRAINKIKRALMPSGKRQPASLIGSA